MVYTVIITEEQNGKTMTTIALYPGTFDPITYGHLDIIESALLLCDTLIVAIAQSNNKKPFIDLKTRTELIKELLASHQNLRVMPFDNLLVDFAQAHHATLIIRGIRNSSDYDYEYQLANTNRALAPTIQTLFLLPKPEHCHISSTFVREINELGGNCSEFVPPLVERALKQQLHKTRNN